MKQKTYSPIIQIIEEDYEIPQLGRRRRIAALLPHDYEETDKQYPVLYLHDGQNLFNGDGLHHNWAIDRGLAQLAQEGLKDLIVITIDHGGEERVTEYSPYYNPQFGEGEGEKYLQFLIETLKPYVDKKFRVLQGREHTGIGGSSMGGLISLFAGITHPDIFGKLLIFSPSLWISPKLFYDLSRFYVAAHTDMYVYAGEKESRNHISNVKRLTNAIFRPGADQSNMRLQVSINPEGTHNETYWRDEFPKAIKWLFFEEKHKQLEFDIQTHLTISDEDEVIILPFFQDELEAKVLAQFNGITTIPAEFDAKAGEMEMIHTFNPDKTIFLLGLGKKKDLYTSAKLFRSLAFKHHAKWNANLCVYLDHLPKDIAFQAALGIRLAMYHPGMFKTDQALDAFQQAQFNLTLIHQDTSVPALIKEALKTADTQIRMMQLVNLPANIKTPAYLASYAEASGAQYGYEVKKTDGKQLYGKGLYSLLEVGRGSENEPQLVELIYKPEGVKSNHPQVGLVGKGITFDTGGISMKGSTNLHYMKSDMGGAVAVLGAIELAARLKLPIHIVGIIPFAENSVDAKSLKPGDIIDSFSRKTIEVIDTDAEGRLILADGLAFIKEKYEPEVLIDLATLTGNCVLTLGYAAAGLFSNNDELAHALEKAGDQVRERVWRLPLYEDFDADLQSDIADIKNYSGKPVAGAITAAKFLEFFVKDHPQWAHIDIAGVAFGDSEFTSMKSATGFGIRLLIEYFKQIVENNEPQ